MSERVTDIVPGLIGATIGGVVGFFAYGWALDHSLKAGVVPGALVGLGGGLVSSRPSWIRGILCGLGALGLGLYAEWRFNPFRADGSFGYLLAHVHQLNPIVLLMIVLGAFLGWRWGGDGFKPSFGGKPASPGGLAD